MLPVKKMRKIPIGGVAVETEGGGVIRGVGVRGGYCTCKRRSEC